MPRVTIHTDARKGEQALNKLKAYADAGGRGRVEAFIESLGGYGPLLALGSKVEGAEIYVTIAPSERLSDFLSTIEA